MKIICVNDKPNAGGRASHLTLGKEYEILKESSHPYGGSINYYRVKLDNGRTMFMRASRFVVAASGPTHISVSPNQAVADYMEMMNKHIENIKGPGFPAIPSIEHSVIAAQERMRQCNHKWDHYIGIREEYDFCVHCDTKRNT